MKLTRPHFRRVLRAHVGAPVLSGVVHAVRCEKNGQLIALCGVVEYDDGLPGTIAETTCERCLRSESALNAKE